MHREKLEWEVERSQSKSYEVCPLNNQRPNQFVQRLREAGGLQRNVGSGRSFSKHPSPYLRQTHNSQRVRLSPMARRDGTKTFTLLFIFYFSFFSFLLFLVFDRCCNAHPTLFRLFKLSITTCLILSTLHGQTY